MSQPEPHPRPKRRWLSLRFSLRTMFIVLTVCGLLLGPISYELVQMREVKRQEKIVRDLGGEVSFDHKKRWSARLVRFLWPSSWRHAGGEIQGAWFLRSGGELDLAKLQSIPNLTEITVDGRRLICSDDSARLPHITKFKYSAFGQTLGKQTDRHVLPELPALRELELTFVTPTAALISDVARCSNLRDVRYTFPQQYTWNRDQPSTYTQNYDTPDLSPWSSLHRLERLTIHDAPTETDWQFLAHLTNIEEAEIRAQHQRHMSLKEWIVSREPAPARTKRPLHYLAGLPRLQNVSLSVIAVHEEDLHVLAERSPIRNLSVDGLADGSDCLLALRGASRLRTLNARQGWPVFSDASEELLLLKRATELEQLETLSLSFRRLTDAHLDYLAELPRDMEVNVSVFEDSLSNDGKLRLSMLLRVRPGLKIADPAKKLR